MVRVADLETGLRFYSVALGHPVLWRTSDAAGLAMPGTDAELVLHTQQGPEVDLLIDAVDQAFERFIEAGGHAIEAPFDIAIGRCAVVRDPFGDTLVMLDQSKGLFVTEADGWVTGVQDLAAGERIERRSV
jgi:predicted enzyme related to lactoylglutathione lyase